MKNNRTRAGLRSVLAFTLLLAGCAGNGDDNSTNLRFFNAVTGVPGVDLFVDLDPFLEDVGYLEGSGYVEYDTDPHFFQVTPSNSLSEIDELTTALEDNVDYTYVVFGTAADAEALLLEDDNEPAASGNFKVRTINVARTVRSIDLFIVADPNDVAQEQPTVAGSRFKQVSDYRAWRAGAYAVVAVDARTGARLGSAPVRDFVSENVYTVLLAPANGGEDVIEVVVLDDSVS